MPTRLSVIRLEDGRMECRFGRWGDSARDWTFIVDGFEDSATRVSARAGVALERPSPERTLGRGAPLVMTTAVYAAARVRLERLPEAARALRRRAFVIDDDVPESVIAVARRFLGGSRRGPKARRLSLGQPPSSDGDDFGRENSSRTAEETDCERAS